MSPERPNPSIRSDYKAFRSLQTRWLDNDIYGHMNNIVHYSLFDTAINGFLIESAGLDPLHGSEMFFVVQTGCRFYAEMGFPDIVTAGLRVAKLGSSSVRYEIGLFQNEKNQAAAEGFFVQVNVDRSTRRPVKLSATTRGILERLTI